jgi:hypothetical protein
MNLTPFVIPWIALAVTVLALFIWRKAVARHEDDKLHVLDGAALYQTALQEATVKKLDMIDKWGKIATVVAVIYGAILGGLYAYQVWLQNTNNI